MAKNCEFGKKNGEPCGADAQTGKSLCVFHDPDRVADGRRARTAGGIHRSRPAVVLPVHPEVMELPIKQPTGFMFGQQRIKEMLVEVMG